MRFTVIQSNKQISKGYALNSDHSLKKIVGGGLSSGIATKTEIQRISELIPIIQRLNGDSAFIWGVNEYESVTIQTEAAARPPESISRSLKNFKWHTECVIPFDYDPEPGQQPLTKEDFYRAVCSLHPLLGIAPALLLDSTSSYIYHGDDCLKGAGGLRLLFGIKLENDLDPKQFFKNYLYWKSFRRFGRIDFSKDGKALDRSLFDRYVFSPERLDFCGGAVCVAPLEQRRPEPLIFNPEAEPLKISWLPDDYSDLKEEYQKQKGKLLKGKRAEQTEVKDRYMDESAQKESARTGRNYQDCRKDFTALTETQSLVNTFTIFGKQFPNGITIAELLSDMDKYSGKTCADPAEPDYRSGSDCAHLNLKDSQPNIFSHAHGGRRYNLYGKQLCFTVAPGTRMELADQFADFCRKQNLIFRHNDALVKICSGKPIELKERAVKGLMDRTTIFNKEKINKATGAVESQIIDCPASLAEGFFHDPDISLNSLKAVAYNPIYDFRHDTIITGYGYDDFSGYWLDYDAAHWKDIPAKPDESDFLRAAGTLFKPFEKFTFKEEIDKSCLLAAILTACLRNEMLTSPGFFISASTPGTGKSLLAKCLGYLADPSGADVLPSSFDDQESDSETRKRLLTIGRTGKKTVIIDNAVGGFKSPALDAFLTAETFTDRILGESRTATIRTNVMLLITGNNIYPVGDAARRWLRIYLDAQSPEPWKRQFPFDPADYVSDHRLSMISAAYTMIRYAKSNTIKGTTGSFRDFDLIRKAVIAWGLPDPISSITDNFNHDTDSNKIKGFLKAYCEAFDSGSKARRRLTDIIKICQSNAETLKGEDGTQAEAYKDLLETLTEISPKLSSKALGKFLSSHAGRIYRVGEMNFRLKVDQSHYGNFFSVEVD